MNILDLPLDLLGRLFDSEPPKVGRFEKLLVWVAVIVIITQIGLIVVQVWLGL